jgi:hypothetical protein
MRVLFGFPDSLAHQADFGLGEPERKAESLAPSPKLGKGLGVKASQYCTLSELLNLKLLRVETRFVVSMNMWYGVAVKSR